MCGIAGMFSPGGRLPGEAVLNAACTALAHRGPDGEAQWLNATNTVWLGHRRLKIIDLSAAAAQPMCFRNRYHIIHNGEIYNYIELRETLTAKGIVFQTASDTEVIAAAYAEYGEQCVKQFNGMFAFAIWDEQEQKLFAARDRFGEKPFYYYFDNNVFAFASEMKALWALGIPKEPDPELMLLYLGLGITNIPQQPGRTFYKKITALPPAHALTISGKETTPRLFTYWMLNSTANKQISAEAATEQFRSLLLDSVKKRMRSDVALGTCLSGGLDSASVLSACRQVNAANYRHICFTAVFPGFEKDEAQLSAETAALFGVQQVVITPTANELANDLEKLLYHQERPVISSSAYAQYCVFKAAKENRITVLLDGQGADETLAGYYRYLHWYLQELVFQPSKLKQEKNAIRKNGLPLEWGINNYAAAVFPRAAAKKLEQKAAQAITRNTALSPEYVREYFSPSFIHKPVVRNLDDILYFTTMQQGLGDLLHMADRNSMAHGVEVRLPFLDHNLVEFIFSLPALFKIHDGFTKWILRHAMQQSLPASVVWNTKKTGFETPQQQWLQNPKTKELVAAAQQQLRSKGILNASVENPSSQNDELQWRYLCAAAF